MNDNETTEGQSKVPEGMVDGKFHALDRPTVEQLRASMHTAIDGLFSNLEFDEKGFVINDFSIEQNRDFKRLCIAGGRAVFLTMEQSLTIKVMPTLSQVEQQIAEIKKREGG